MTRKSYSLTDRELKQLKSLPEEEGVAFEFWGNVANSRGLDYKTVIGDEYNRSIFTAMSYDHGKDWCWPIPLKCHKKARWNGSEVYYERDKECHQ
jgi:hypothetical protein